MARNGINKKMVEQAIARLHAAQTAVTVDAVRAELGHTGSKTTICRFMNELEQAQLTQGSKQARLSDTLIALVADVANTLHDDIQSPLMASDAKLRAAQQEWQARLDEQQQTLEDEQARYQALEAQCETLREQVASLECALQDVNLQQVKDTEIIKSLRIQLSSQEKHRASLEEKHMQARDALHHFREATKTQREQDVQRHDNQVQLLQSELRQAQQEIMVKHQDNANLRTAHTQLERDNTHLQATLSDTQKTLTRQHSEQATLQDTLGEVRTELALLVKENHTIVAQRDTAISQLATLDAQYGTLSHANTQLTAELRTKDTMLNQWMTHGEAAHDDACATLTPRLPK